MWAEVYPGRFRRSAEGRGRARGLSWGPLAEQLRGGLVAHRDEPNIPLALPDIGPDEEAEVIGVLRSGRLALGPKALEFERQVSAFSGFPWAVSVSSGTAGLHLAVRALGIGPEDCVVTSSFSFIASSNCLRYEGAEPVFVDIDPDTLCLSPDLLRAYLDCCKDDGEVLRDPRTGRRVAGILPVDVFGRSEEHTSELQS